MYYWENTNDLNNSLQITEKTSNYFSEPINLINLHSNTETTNISTNNSNAKPICNIDNNKEIKIISSYNPQQQYANYQAIAAAAAQIHCKL